MNNFNRECGINFERKIVSGWTKIEQRTEGYKKIIVIKNNRKRLVTFAMILLLPMIYFILQSHDYFPVIIIPLVILCLFISLFLQKICIIKNTLDGSIVIKNQAVFNNKTTVYKKEKNLSLKLFKFFWIDKTTTNRFVVAIISDNKKTILRYVNSPFPFTIGNRWHDHIVIINSQEAENISNFLNIPLLSEIGDTDEIKSLIYTKNKSI